FEAEARTAPVDDVDREVRVLPVLELLHGHPELDLTAPPVPERHGEGAQEDVSVPGEEVPRRVAHGRRAVAASAGLMEHHGPVAVDEADEQVDRLLRERDAGEVLPLDHGGCFECCCVDGHVSSSTPASTRSSSPSTWTSRLRAHEVHHNGGADP